MSFSQHLNYDFKHKGMDYDHVEMDAFLKASIPQRFQNVTPFDFEDFIAVLLKEGGYDVEQTDYTGDFGADMIIEEDDGTRTVVQVKRFAETASVGVHDLNQVVASQKYYDAEQAMVIATCGFTKSAEKMAESAEVELWDWNRLMQEISSVFLDEQDYFEYFREELENAEDADVELTLQTMVFDDDEDPKYHRLIFELENLSGRHLHCQLEMPLIMTNDRRQIEGIDWIDGYFSSGQVYNGARVEIGARFLSSQIREIEKGDRLIQRIYLPKEDASMTVEDEILGKKGSGCLGIVLMMAVLLLISMS